MGRKPVRKLGVLSKDERLYIAEHFLWYDNEWIAKKLKRGISYINTYVDRLKHKDKTDKIDQAEKQEIAQDLKKKFVTVKDSASVMTQEASTSEYKPKKYESPFKYE